MFGIKRIHGLLTSMAIVLTVGGTGALAQTPVTVAPFELSVTATDFSASSSNYFPSSWVGNIVIAPLDVVDRELLDPQTIPIEIVALNLQSVDPIPFSPTTAFDVQMSLAPLDPKLDPPLGVFDFETGLPSVPGDPQALRFLFEAGTTSLAYLHMRFDFLLPGTSTIVQSVPDFVVLFDIIPDSTGLLNGFPFDATGLQGDPLQLTSVQSTPQLELVIFPDEPPFPVPNIPEPGTMTLFGAGLLGLLALRRRRRSASA